LYKTLRGHFLSGAGGGLFTFLLVTLIAPAVVSGQSTDERLLRFVYGMDNEGATLFMRGINASAYPVFYATPLLMWTYAATTTESADRQTAWNVSVTSLATYGAVKVTKNAFGRPRPFREMDDIRNREPTYLGIWPESVEDYSFPSGHASLAFALATSISLSHSRWYVVLPAYGWASGVAASRVWHGVHYPGDVLAGALLGSSVALAVHRLAPHLTPGIVGGRIGEDGGAVLYIVLPVGR
jgi:membrane-associated phospholipid phosphatase